MQLTKSQVDTILKNAPPGADKTKILDGLITRGYELEGVDTAQAKQIIATKQAPEQKGFVQRIGEKLGERKENIVDIQKLQSEGKTGVGEVVSMVSPKLGEKVNNTMSDITEKHPTLAKAFRSLLPDVPVIGQLAGGVQDIVGETLSTVTPEKWKEWGAEKAQQIAKTTLGEAGIKTMEDYTQWAEKYPLAAKNIEGSVNIALTLADVVGAGETASLVSQGAKRTGQVISEGAEQLSKQAGQAVGEIASATKGARDIVGMVTDEAARIPSRIATNVAEKQATRATIKELPGEIAQRAAQDGIDPTDVKLVYSIPKESKAIVKELVDTTKNFANGTTKINPIEVVGKPIVSGIKTAQSSLTKVGEKLGNAANNLGSVTRKEIVDPVFNALKKVKGLEGLTMDAKGGLSFKNTVLATAETASDRKAIQQIFKDAIKSGTGKQKHLLRQELFETLGGKKASLSKLTATQEKAYDAIRSGLSNVLEGKNPAYKLLSNEYRKLAQPLQDLRKFMKTIPGADEDILEMSAGLLARRLTSNATSNPQIRSILRALDKAVGKGGKITGNTELMQDLYNVLNKYYDIANKTGFQGQVKAGIESANGLTDIVVNKIKGFAGETSAVRQKALESILADILK